MVVNLKWPVRNILRNYLWTCQREIRHYPLEKSLAQFLHFFTKLFLNFRIKLLRNDSRHSGKHDGSGFYLFDHFLILKIVIILCFKRFNRCVIVIYFIHSKERLQWFQVWIFFHNIVFIMKFKFHGLNGLVIFYWTHLDIVRLV